MIQEPRNPVRTVETTISILEALKELGGAGTTELATHLGLSKGTVHNHLMTLAQAGFVVRDDDAFRVGLRCLEFGEYAKQQREMCAIAKPEVEKLAAETGEIANLMVEEGGRGIYLLRESGDQALTLDTGRGARVYLHATALGKAILAHLPPDRVERIVEHHGLPRLTDRTITDRDELADELEAVRERGYAYDRGERVGGIRCVAAVVQTNDGEVLGAVSVTGPRRRIQGRRLESDVPQLVQNAADVVGINATYSL